MKLLRTLSCLAGAALLAFSCEPDKLTAPSVSFPDSGKNVYGDGFPAAGGVLEIDISITGADSIRVEAWSDANRTTASDWLSASYSKPKIRLEAAENTGDARSAFLLVTVSNSIGSAEAYLQIGQAAGNGGNGNGNGNGENDKEPELEIDVYEMVEVPAEGASFEVRTTTNCEYIWIDAYDDTMEWPDWLDFDDGTTEDDILFIVSPNRGEERYAIVEIYATLVDWEALGWAEDVPSADAYFFIYQEAGNGGGGGEGEDPEYPAGAGVYVKVLTKADLAAGWYLIVSESKSVAFDGSLAAGAVDTNPNFKTVSISDGRINVDAALAASAMWFNPADGSFRSSEGYYICYDGDRNGMSASNTVKTNTVSISEGNAEIINESDKYLQSNRNDGRFRFYRNASEKPVQLYKMPEAAAVPAFGVSTTVLTAGPKVTSVSFDVKASDSVNWTVSSSNPEFAVSPAAGSGPATVTVSFGANTEPQERGTVLTVATDNEEVETKSFSVTVTQSPASEGSIDDGTPGYNDHLNVRRKLKR